MIAYIEWYAVWLYHFWKSYCPFSLRILHQKDGKLNSVIQHFTQHLSPRMMECEVGKTFVLCQFKPYLLLSLKKNKQKGHITVKLLSMCHVIFILAILTVLSWKKPVRTYHMETLYIYFSHSDYCREKQQ